MTFNRLILLMFTATILTFAACGDDDEGGSFTAADLTIAAGWRVTAAETNLDDVAEEIGNAIPEEDLEPFGRDFFVALLVIAAADLELVEDCEADDVYTFAEGGSIGFDNSGTLCDGSVEAEEDAAFVLPASWSLNGDALIITDGDGDTFPFKILTLNGTTLEIEIREMFTDEDLNVSTDTEIVIKYTMRAVN